MSVVPIRRTDVTAVLYVCLNPRTYTLSTVTNTAFGTTTIQQLGTNRLAKEVNRKSLRKVSLSVGRSTEAETLKSSMLIIFFYTFISPWKPYKDYQAYCCLQCALIKASKIHWIRHLITSWILILVNLMIPLLHRKKEYYQLLYLNVQLTSAFYCRYF